MKISNLLVDLNGVEDRIKCALLTLEDLQCQIYEHLDEIDDGPFVVVEVAGIDGMTHGISRNPTDVFPPIVCPDYHTAHNRMLEFNTRIREEEE